MLFPPNLNKARTVCLSNKPVFATRPGTALHTLKNT